MKRTWLIELSIIVLILLSGCKTKQNENVKYNIVVFLADDMGYGDLGCYGCKDIRTPNIDKLASQGVRFTQFYANGPECTPTRAALLTGRYQQRVGGLECAIGAGNVGRYNEAEWLAEKKELGLPVGEATLISSLKSAGYTTAMLGKWHLGYENEFRPVEHGFDYSLGPIGYGGDYFYHIEQVQHGLPDFSGAHTLAENGKEAFYDGHYTTELISEKAIEWLDKRDKSQPFFLYLPFTAPHSPYQGPGDNLGRPLQTEEEWAFASREKYVEMTESLDTEIGRILNYLSDNQLEKETIVIFFSDNGGTKIANNGPLSGIKGQVFEGGIRVPCIIRWPGKISENSVTEQTSISFDLSKSIVKLVDGNEKNLKLDGYDILKHIVQHKENVPRTLFWRIKRGDRVQKAVRAGDMKYLISINNEEIQTEKMFDLNLDQSEKNDLLNSLPETAANLKKELLEWEEEVAAPRLANFYTTKSESN